MVNEEHLKIFKQGVEVWNKWKKDNPKLKPDLSQADLRGVDLRVAKLRGVNLRGADVSRTNISEAFKDQDSEVRWRVAEALGKIGPAAKEAVLALIEALKGQDTEVLGVAEWALRIMRGMQRPKGPKITVEPFSSLTGKSLSDEERQQKEEEWQKLIQSSQQEKITPNMG